MVDERLITAAADLARAAPESWKKFLEAMAARDFQVKVELTNSPADSVHGYQGRAREVAHLLKIFQTCVPTAEKIRGKG